ncbi:MAG TPA: hypothetical protein PKL10_15520 [Nitrospira sp.]|nr:hypothetical protein [Nitrospira sp.]HNN43706.1 hypothetical protein [Nitrospira sp.]
MRQGIDGKLAEWREQLDEWNHYPGTTPVDLLELFPTVLGNSLSGEEAHVTSVMDTMANLQQQLKDAGIDLDDRFTTFPDRLAGLQRDYERQQASKSSKTGDAGPSKA